MHENSRYNYGIVLPQWVFGDDADALVECAVAAEEAGWDGIFLADHLIFPPPGELGAAERETEDNADFLDPWITMAGIATSTDAIRLGSWITPVPRRQPWQLARDLATLDHLSDGRVILGTGLGRGTEYTTFGREYDQRDLGRRYDEALAVIDGLWRGESFSYDGEHFTVDEAVVLPRPVQRPRIPVVVGGVWPNKKPIRRGVRWDGIIPHWRGDGIVPADGDVDAAETVREMLEYYHDHADDPGEIVLPLDPPGAQEEYLDICADLGVTWLYSRDLMAPEFAEDPTLAIDRIREGPPD